MRSTILLFFAITACISAGAVNYTWTGSVDSLWSNASNWSGGGSYPSSAADNATFNNNTIDDDVVLTENITVNNINWNERKNRGLDLNSFDLTVDGDVNIATRCKMNNAKSNGQMILNGDFNLGSRGQATIYDINQTSGTLDIATRATFNHKNPNTKVNITLDQIVMAEKSYLIFQNTKNITLSDIDVAQFCIVEFPLNKTVTFTSTVNWSESDCSTYNTFRSFRPGTQTKLKFTGGASTGNFNVYEDVRIITSGGGNTFTANNRTDLGNNTNISGSTRAAVACEFDGNGNNTGNWSNDAEWTCGCAPRSIDDVTIQANKTVTVDNIVAQCDDLTFVGTNSRISGTNGQLLEVHGDFTTVDEDNMSSFLGRTELRNDVTATTEILSCTGCDTVKFFGQVQLEFPGNTWQLNDHLVVSDPNDSKRGDLTITRGELDLNNFDLHVENDFDLTSNGTFTPGTGELRMIDAENSTITMNGTGNLYDLVIDKSSSTNRVDLSTNVVVTNSLSLTGLGIVTPSNTNQDTLILNDNATSTAGSDGCHVNASMLKIGNDDFTFPLGNGTHYRPIGVTDMAANSTATDRLYARYILDNPFNNGMTWTAWPGSINNVSTREYWEIDDLSGSPTPKILLSWKSPTPSGTVGNLADIRVTHWNGASFDDLGNASTTGNTAVGTVTSSANVTSFSPFVIGSASSNNPLPVELLSFNAQAQGESNFVKWQTATEINVSHFEVYRSVNGGSTFELLHEYPAAGFSTETLGYDFADDKPGYKSYYYLKSVDFDGTYSTSETVVVEREIKEANFAVYPNPTQGDFRLDGFSEEVYAEVYGLDGRRVHAQSTSLESNYKISLPKGLSPGFYTLNVDGGSSIRFILK